MRGCTDSGEYFCEINDISLHVGGEGGGGRSSLNPTGTGTQEPPRGRVPVRGAFTVHGHLDLNAM
ncbi:hypothetical protein EYF80_043092 [Liparis tanakae]|uniref:Uncharacterized protein n=1 Tax=Liparis tanakae TaxID=230148 RepID=A0A4Z2G1G1_9TELE|nr:hypothetical protein EYF80_043092 [Liparis tanakae]